MMGLTPREAQRRFDEVIEFAELEEFSDLKLKNYSSGMLVRLGFSLMTQVDADVLLIDEVLAVGDAAFQQKSFDAFSRLHREGRTIVLVTHDMTTVAGPLRPGDAARARRDRPVRRSGRRRAPLPASSTSSAAAPSSSRATCGSPAAGRSRASPTSRSSTPPAPRSPASRRDRAIRIAARVEALDAGSSGRSSASRSSTPTGCRSSRPRRPSSTADDRVLEAGDRGPTSSSSSRTRSPSGPLLRAPGARPARPSAEMIAFRKHAADFVVFGAGAVRRPRDRSSTRPQSIAAAGSRLAMSAADRARAARDHRPVSAFGGGRRRFFDLLWLMSVTEFKLGYHGTALGFAWSFVRPLMLFGVLLVVFTQVFRFGDDVKNYPAMLLLQHHAVHLLRRRDRQGRHLGRRQRERGPQDAVPAPRDPALGRAHERAPAGAQPDRRLRLPDRLRRRAGLDLDPDPADHPRDRDDHDRGLDAALGALRPGPRRRDHLGRGRDAALLRRPRSSIRSTKRRAAFSSS